VKFKTSKYFSVFFLISFFVSFCCSVGVSANAYSSQFSNSHPKDRLHLNEKVISSNIEQVIIEETDNENELDFDLALVLVPYLLDFSNLYFSTSSFNCILSLSPKAINPIYIAVCNFRI
jgi:hypothetical protein